MQDKSVRMIIQEGHNNPYAEGTPQACGHCLHANSEIIRSGEKIPKKEVKYNA